MGPDKRYHLKTYISRSEYALRYSGESYVLQWLYMGHGSFSLYGRLDADEEREKLSRIALRVDHDFCVNGFLSNPDVKAYGGQVDKRPEFLSYLTERFPELKAVKKQWEQESTSYQVVFFAYPHQTARFQFELDANYDIPFPDWLELSDDLKMKKKLLSLALNTAYDGPGEQYLYIKDGCYIPPEQIIAYDVLGK